MQLTKNQGENKARIVPKASLNFLLSTAASRMPACDGTSTQVVPSSSCINNKAQIQAPLYKTVKLPT